MSRPKFKLDNNAPTVSWADPKSADASASQVFDLRMVCVMYFLFQVNLVEAVEHTHTQKDDLQNLIGLFHLTGRCM